VQIDYETVPVDALSTFEGNPRRGDVDAIAASLRSNGQYKPIVVNRGSQTGRANEVLAGNHTLLAARGLDWPTIEVAFVDVDTAGARAIVAADNRTSDLGSYDQQALFELLDSLDTLDGTGYDPAFIADLEHDLFPPQPHTDPDDVPDAPADPVTEPGQVWQLGEHRLLVGDATDLAAVEAMLAGEQPTVVWTDPPYGVEYVGKTKDSLTIRNDGSAGLAGLLDGAFGVLSSVCAPGVPVYVAHADTERVTFETAMLTAGLKVRQNLIWVKNTIVLGRSDYQYKHEPILYGFTPGGRGRLGRGGARWHGDNSQATVFEVPKPARSSAHPTMKPVALISSMLANSGGAGAVVFDPFAGSGSTLIAAHGLGMVARLVELDPSYADVICRRFEEHTGITPTCEGRAVSFADRVAA
jgi:DNA modification methylase